MDMRLRHESGYRAASGQVYDYETALLSNGAKIRCEIIFQNGEKRIPMISAYDALRAIGIAQPKSIIKNRIFYFFSFF